MALVWDEIGEKIYETGVDHGVLYAVDPVTGLYGTGVPWNGLVSVTEAPSGAENNPQYADNIKYINLRSAEEFGGTIEAFTYPDEFAACDGTAMPVEGVGVGQQNRTNFGMSYRTIIGNDTKNTDHGYKLHLLYGLSAAPSEKQYQTLNDSPEAITFSWEFSSTPAPVTGLKPTSIITLDSTKVAPEVMKAVEDLLYGSTGTAKLPTPDEVLAAAGYVALAG